MKEIALKVKKKKKKDMKNTEKLGQESRLWWLQISCLIYHIVTMVEKDKQYGMAYN